MPFAKTLPAADLLALDPGELRHQVQLCHRQAIQDASGQPANIWTAYRTTMAAIRNLTGKELFQGDEFTSAAQVEIKLRWTDDNTVPGDRVLFQAHTYVVQICDNVQLRNRVLRLACVEINGAS